MMEILRDMRGFLTKDDLDMIDKGYNPLKAANVLVIQRYEKDPSDGITKHVCHLFTDKGILVGTIRDPQITL